MNDILFLPSKPKIIFKEKFNFNSAQKEAKKGNLEAMYRLSIFLEGDGAKKDLRKSMEWLRKAADKGLAKAKERLSYLLYVSENITNKEEIFNYAKSAADAGLASAINNLGLFYVNGFCVDKDVEKAYNYFKKSADIGDKYAKFNLANFYFNGILIKQDQQVALEIYAELASENIREAIFMLGKIYADGLQDLVPKDSEKSFQLFSKAASLGLPEAEFLIGNYYLDDNFANKDEEKALQFLKSAADKNFVQAMYAVGKIYVDKTSKYYNYKKGFEYIKSASDHGLLDAKVFCIYEYLERQDDDNAKILLNDIVEEHPQYYKDLAFCYYDKVLEKQEAFFEEFGGCYNIDEEMYMYDDIYDNINLHYSKYDDDYEDSFGADHFGDVEPSENAIAKPALYYYDESINPSENIEYYYDDIRIDKSIKENLDKAIFYYRKGAENNDDECEYELGRLFIPRQDKFFIDLDRSLYWLNLGLEHGNQKSAELLGLYYGDLLDGVKNANPDYKKSVEILSKVGDEQVLGLFVLANMYAFGNYVEKDEKRAFDLFSRSANKLEIYTLKEASLFSYYNLACAYEYGFGVEKDELKALELFKNIDQYSIVRKYANEKLARYYIEGRIVDRDLKTAYEYAFEAYKKALPYYCLFDTVIFMQFASLGCEQDLLLLRSMMHEAMRLPSSNQLLFQGILHEDGTFLYKSLVEAACYYQLSAEENNPGAMVNLSLFYAKGIVFEKDEGKAFELCEKAANLDHAIAQTNLGVMYKVGIGVEPNDDRAVEWFMRASQQNDDVAKKYLNDIDKTEFSIDLLRKNYDVSFINVKEVLDKTFTIGSVIDKRSLNLQQSFLDEIAIFDFMHHDDIVPYRANNYIGMFNNKSFNLYNERREKFYKDLSENGNIEAKTLYGKMLVLRFEFAEGADNLYDAADDDNILGKYFFAKFLIEDNDYIDNDIDTGIQYLFDAAQELKSPDVYFTLAQQCKNHFDAEIITELDITHDQIFDWYTTSYEGGDIRALLSIARCYQAGEGVNINYKKAFDYYSMALDHGNTFAYISLGNMYLAGQAPGGFDEDKALECFQKSADSGEDFAYYMLWKLYSTEDSKFYNINKSITFLKKAADRGISQAQQHLASFYHQGINVAHDNNKAIYYFKKVADDEHPEYYRIIGSIYREDTFDFKPNYQESVKYFKKAIDLGDAQAAREIAKMVEADFIYDNDESIALDYYKQSYDMDEDNFFNSEELGRRYYLGIGTEPNPVASKQYFDSMKSSLKGLYRYAIELELGLNTDKNIKEAINCYTECISKGLYLAYVRLGEIYSRGIDVKKDENKAFDYFNKAAYHEIPLGYVRVGDCYKNGIGVEEDEGEAYDWYDRAADEDYHEGLYKLALCYSRGIGVEKDKYVSLDLLHQAEMANSIDAALLLVKHFKAGDIIKKDDRIANMHQFFAAFLGDLDSFAYFNKAKLSSHRYLEKLETIHPFTFRMNYIRKYNKIHRLYREIYLSTPDTSIFDDDPGSLYEDDYFSVDDILENFERD